MKSLKEKYIDPIPHQDWVFPFGKFRGQQLGDIPLKQLDSYFGWLQDQDHLSGLAVEAYNKMREYLDHWQVQEWLDRELEDRPSLGAALCGLVVHVFREQEKAKASSGKENHD